MKTARIVRLSHSLTPGDARFPGNPDVQVRQCHSFENGDECNTFEVSFFNHNGTHIDFPRHYVKDGKALGDYSMSDFVFEHVAVVDYPSEKGTPLTPDHIQPKLSHLSSPECLLLRTGFQKYRSESSYASGPYITRELARWMRRNLPSLRCIGLDTLSITSSVAFDEGQEVHRILLEGASPPFVIEDMDMDPLDGATSIQRLFVAPWFVTGVDGGPCTVFAEMKS